MRRRRTIRDHQLYVILERGDRAPSEVIDLAGDVLAAGARMLCWRDKYLSAKDFFDVGEGIATLCASFAADLIVHDRADVCLALAARGVHRPGDGLPLDAIRDCVGRDAWVGQRAHSVDEIRAMRGASFVTLSPIFETASKPGYGPALDIGALVSICQIRRDLPVFALGGVTPERVAACLEAGAQGVAVMGGICRDPDPFEATLRYLEAIEQAMARAPTLG